MLGWGFTLVRLDQEHKSRENPCRTVLSMFFPWKVEHNIEGPVEDL